MCYEYHVRISANWREESECCRVLTVPTLLVFAYYSGVFLRENGGLPAIWRTAITEHVVMALLRLLVTGRDGALGVACIDLQMGCNGQCVLVPFPSSVRHEVHDIGLLEIICVSSLNAVA